MDVLEILKDDVSYYGEFGKQYLSNSDIGTLLTNPKAFGISRPDNANFAKGRLFHQLILEPEKASEWEFIDVASRNTKAYKEFVAERDVEFALLQKEADEINELVTTMMSNMDFYDDIRNEGNQYEVPAVGEIEGVMWKGKADIVHPEMIIDLKTTSNIDDFKWSAFLLFGANGHSRCRTELAMGARARSCLTLSEQKESSDDRRSVDIQYETGQVARA